MLREDEIEKEEFIIEEERECQARLIENKISNLADFDRD